MAFYYEILTKTAAAWASDTTTIPKLNQETLESDTGFRKLGDGTTTNHSLPYLGATGNVLGQSSSVDGETALFSGTGGKTIKRSTLTGVPKQASGVQSGTAATINDLGAQTADYSAASHKITSVTDPTSAQDAATKNYVDTRLYVAELTSAGSVSNSVAETTLWTAANMAAAALSAGVTLLRVRIGGTFDNIVTASGSFTGKLKINGNTIATITIAPNQTGGAATNTPYWLDFDIYVDVTGATGSVTLVGNEFVISSAGGAKNFFPIVQQTSLINLTGGLQVTFTGQMTTANAGNVLRASRASVSQIA